MGQVALRHCVEGGTKPGVVQAWALTSAVSHTAQMMLGVNVAVPVPGLGLGVAATVAAGEVGPGALEATGLLDGAWDGRGGDLVGVTDAGAALLGEGDGIGDGGGAVGAVVAAGALVEAGAPEAEGAGGFHPSAATQLVTTDLPFPVPLGRGTDIVVALPVALVVDVHVPPPSPPVVNAPARVSVAIPSVLSRDATAMRRVVPPSASTMVTSSGRDTVTVVGQGPPPTTTVPAVQNTALVTTEAASLACTTCTPAWLLAMVSWDRKVEMALGTAPGSTAYA